MVIVDNALKKRYQEGNPVRVAMVGAGFMGRGIALQILGFAQGMDLVAISNRSIEGAGRAFIEAGVEEAETASKEFAKKWNQKPHMVTSFADGTKIAFEQAVVANATGIRVARRGMIGPVITSGTPIKEAAGRFPVDEILKGAGIVDYVVGGEPSPGVFVLGFMEDPAQRRYLELYKMGSGPVYCFYTPYHLCHFEVQNTVARAVLFGDAAVTPAGAPSVGVVATAKTDLKAGQVLDGIGQFMTYGQCENWDVIRSQNLLPMGLAEGCRLKRDIPRDQVIISSDVERPPGRISDRLEKEQNEYFGTPGDAR